jgi:hypothetical protein
MKKGASIAAPDDPAVWQIAAIPKYATGESFMAPDYSN